MINNNKIAKYSTFDESLLHIKSDEVLKRIKKGEDWEGDVPESVMKAIKFYNLFGYHPEKKKDLVSSN